MCLAQGPQRSDAGEARTRNRSVSSQALYHWATALPASPWENQQNNPLYMGNPLKLGTFTNSEDPDEMPHYWNAA